MKHSYKHHSQRTSCFPCYIFTTHSVSPLFFFSISGICLSNYTSNFLITWVVYSCTYCFHHFFFLSLKTIAFIIEYYIYTNYVLVRYVLLLGNNVSVKSVIAKLPTTESKRLNQCWEVLWNNVVDPIFPPTVSAQVSLEERDLEVGLQLTILTGSVLLTPFGLRQVFVESAVWSSFWWI